MINILKIFTLWSILWVTPFSTTDKLAKEEAPDFEFVLADGTTKKLSDYRGQVVYVSFWASWCGPCLKNFKKYEATRAKLADMGVVLLNVSVDETQAAYKNLLQRQPIIGTNAWTAKDATLQENYELFAIPTYHIITKDGQFYYLGDGGNRDIFGEFQALLDK